MKEWYRDDTAVISLEESFGKYFFHVNVFKWSPEVAKHGIDVLVDLQTVLSEQGVYELYAGIDKQDTKLVKFAELYGFFLIAETDTHYLYKKEW